MKPFERYGVRRHAVVVVVPSQLLRECAPLHLDRIVTVPTAPFRDTAQRAAEAVLRRTLLHDPLALAGQPPVVREAEQIEGPGAIVVSVVGTRPAKRHQPRLVRLQR